LSASGRSEERIRDIPEVQTKGGRPTVTAVVTCGKSLCVWVRIVLGARRDPRSRSDSEIQTIQDREVKKPFGGKGVCVRVVSEASTELTSVGRRINVSTMPPRRCVDPPVANRAMEREMRELRARLDAMETTQRRAPDAGDVSEAEIENIEVKLQKL
jgi:hypothetical protein